MSRVWLISLMAAIAVSPSPAHAVAFRFANSAAQHADPGAQSTEFLVASFDGDDSLHYDKSDSSHYGLFTGSHANVAAAPAGDPSQYVAVGAGGSMTFDLRSYNTATDALASLSVYVGSVDVYNFISIYGLASDGQIDYGAPLMTVSGADLIGAEGGHPDGRLSFGFSDLDRIGAVEFGSAGVAFEFDSIAISTQRVRGPALRVGSVPEPKSWAFMLVGFGAIGGAMRSRREAAVTFAAKGRERGIELEGVPPRP